MHYVWVGTRGVHLTNESRRLDLEHRLYLEILSTACILHRVWVSVPFQRGPELKKFEYEVSRD